MQIVIGPLSGDEGLAVKDYAKTQPNVTFVNGTSAAQDTTLRDPAPNFFRFSTDGAQWMAGPRHVRLQQQGLQDASVTVAEDYSFPYTQVFGFMAEFCKAGGKVVDKSWVPIGNKDFSSVIAAIPADVDAVYVALGGADGVNFLTQYEQAGGTAPLIGGSITVDQTVLGSEGKRQDVRDRHAVGRPDRRQLGRPELEGVRRRLQGGLPGRLPEPVALRARLLRQHARRRCSRSTRSTATSPTTAPSCARRWPSLEFDTPTGMVKLDENRNAIADIFVTEVAEGEDGNLYNKVVEVKQAVNQTLGQPVEEFLKLGAVGRDNPSCP